MAGVSIRVTGRVQGVGFRHHVRRIALELGLSGEVWNCHDGSVRAELHGPADALRQAVERVRAGPGRVEGVESSPIEGAEAPSGFTIGPSRP